MAKAFGLTFLCLLFLLSGCAQQRIRDKAQSALDAEKFQEAIGLIQAGLVRYPESASLRLAMLHMREASVVRLLAKAASARTSGQLTQAQGYLQQAQALDSANERVVALLEDIDRQMQVATALSQAQQMLDKRDAAGALKHVNQALGSWPNDLQLLSLQRRLEMQALHSGSKGTHLALAEDRTISLDFRNTSLRTVLDVVSRNSGINFIFDKDIQTDSKVTVLLRDARVEDAIDLLVSTHQLAKRVVDPKTILIYPNTPEKQKEHQEQVVRVFYLSSAEAKGAAAFLKSMLKINDPFVDERSNMLSLRESPENVHLAERLMVLYDSQEPEVLLDVEVIEVRSSKLTELGVKVPDTFSLTPLAPNGGTTGLTLGNVRGINADRIGVSVSSVLLNLKREVGNVNILANPKIRVKSKQIAKVLIGDKIPVVTATVGTGGFVSDSVSYLDVGLKLEVEPVVYVDDEVSIKIGLEVSSIGNSIKTSSGTQAFQIGTRNATTTLRLRDGETQMLAGLINREDRTTSSRIPGAGDLPVLGRLFSSQQDDNSRTELVLAITPHIVRNQRYPDITQTELWVGTDMQPGFKAPAVPGAEMRSGSQQAAAILPSSDAPIDRLAQASQDGVEAAFAWQVPSVVKMGDIFEVSLDMEVSEPLKGGSLLFEASRGQFEVIEVLEGGFFKRDGVPSSFTYAIEGAEGRVKVGVLSQAQAGSENSGRVLTFKVKALKPGLGTMRLSEFSAMGVSIKQRQPLPLTASIEVK